MRGPSLCSRLPFWLQWPWTPPPLAHSDGSRLAGWNKKSSKVIYPQTGCPMHPHKKVLFAWLGAPTGTFETFERYPG